MHVFTVSFPDFERSRTDTENEIENLPVSGAMDLRSLERLKGTYRPFGMSRFFPVDYSPPFNLINIENS